MLFTRGTFFLRNSNHMVLDRVKNSAVNVVFPIWPMVELPNLCFSNT